MANWGQLAFQDPATPTIIIMYNFHGHAIFIVTWIVLIVGFFILSLIINKFHFIAKTDAQTLETIWTILPCLLIIMLALPSLRILYVAEEIEHPALTLKATGHQWYWRYEYTSFKDTDFSFSSYIVPEDQLKGGDYRLLEVDNRLVVPTDTNIRIIVTSDDVIHSWAIPSAGIKIDAIPGRLNQIYFFLLRPGVFYGQCSEICGANHSFIPIAIEGISIKDFLSWITAISNNQ